MAGTVPRTRSPRAGCEIVLVRHGQTALNAAGRFRGREDPPLDRRGVAEASRAARSLAALGVSVVCTSPLRRARSTGRAIAEECRVALRVVPALVDLDYGRWTGWTPEEARADDARLYRRFRHEPEAVRLPGGEAVREVRTRVEGALKGLAVRYGAGPVVAVTHDVPIRLVVAHACGRMGPGVWRGAVPTGSITRLRVTPTTIRVVGAVGSRRLG